MVKLSGFTFIHNAIANGLPIFEAIKAVQPFVDEMVVVDMGSTDGTRELLHKTGATIHAMPWIANRAYFNEIFLKHSEYCSGDVIIFFEADEVYDDKLLREIILHVELLDIKDIAVHRLQLEQNFQRCRWYPTTVHRVFPRGGGSYVQHPVKHPSNIFTIMMEYGLLWDVSNCFRDNIQARREDARQIWGQARRLYVREHFTQPVEVNEKEEAQILQEPHWEWTITPFNIPDVLKPLVGKTKYEPTI